MTTNIQYTHTIQYNTLHSIRCFFFLLFWFSMFSFQQFVCSVSSKSIGNALRTIYSSNMYIFSDLMENSKIAYKPNDSNGIRIDFEKRMSTFINIKRIEWKASATLNIMMKITLVLKQFYSFSTNCYIQTYSLDAYIEIILLTK